MSEELRKFTDVDRVLHEPARLLIATLLYGVEKVDFLYLLRETGLTKGNLSAHLAKLENAGYVTIEKTFRGKIPQTLIALSGQGRSAFDVYRKQLANIVSKITEE
jgi:DNA-binding transcriptional ArsR family regulator